MTGSELEPLRRVVLAISSYKNDASVLGLLARVRSSGAPFGAVLVVDSLGTGAVEAALQQVPLACPTRYVSADTNLGSAGNFAERLRLAGSFDLDWVYAVNHDGDVRPEAIAELVRIGARERLRSQKPVGAVYPLRRLSSRDGAYDITGRFPVPLTAVRAKSAPNDATVEVYWSSSNGALYSLAPVRQGILPWADLWMGYEDLGYGWLLRERGYRQLLASSVVVDDNYEYAQRGGVWVTQKPPWYAYYYARNFLLVSERTHQPFYARTAVWGRVLLEYGATAVFRDRKPERMRLLTYGIFDALRRRAGKYRLP